MTYLSRIFGRLVVLLAAILSAVGEAADLYRVDITSHRDALALRQADVDALLRLSDGYLVLVDADVAARLTGTGLRCDLIAVGLGREHLALDIRQDESDVGRYPLVFEEKGVRLVRADPHDIHGTTEPSGLAPVLTDQLPITFQEPPTYRTRSSPATVDLDSLISMVLQDSIESYAYRLEAFSGRVSGTDSNLAARDWMVDRFTDFGYDSIVIDHFVETINSTPTLCHNVIAYKIGSQYPDHHVIVGAHRDAVPGSPGADDNGSGIDAVLEIARVLSDIETRLTVVFILFDAEEWGLYGSWHYANDAVARGDSIVVMINMDMIGHYENSDRASVVYDDDSSFAVLWQHLADSLSQISITADINGLRGSDHDPFRWNGYDVISVHEYVFSTVYHSPYDSTSYLNFDYLMRMTKATLAVAYVVADTYAPPLRLAFNCPGGVPSTFLPMTPITLQLDVNEYWGAELVPSSVQLHYCIDGGTPVSEPMIEAGGLFETELPPQSCFSTISFYYSAEEASTGTWYYPDSASPFRAAFATQSSVIFEDNFNSDKGWSVSGDCRHGTWERAVPIFPDYYGAPPFDYDGSGYCYVTDNRQLLWVDQCLTRLASPEIDVSGGPALVHYARWYSNDYPQGTPYEDTLKVFLIHGFNWVLAETVGPVDQASGGWYVHDFWVNDFFTPTNPIRVRFDASDVGASSIVEAAVDDFRVTLFTCEPLITTESLPDWTAGIAYSQRLEAVGCCTTFVWTDKNDDLIGTGLTVWPDGSVSGIPSSTGAINFTAVATDDSAQTDEKPFAFQINLPPTITTDTVPPAQAGQEYSFQLEANGGTGILMWSDRDGDLLGTGLTLAAEGVLSGVPGDTGSISFTSRVEDEAGAYDETQLTLVVGPDYICGNVDALIGPGGGVDVADLTYLVEYLFNEGPEPPVMAAANVDGITGPGGPVDVADLTYLVAYLFQGGPEPVCE